MIRPPAPSWGIGLSHQLDHFPGTRSQDADPVGRPSRGYDAGQKVNGRKRFIATDTLGLLLAVLVTPASVYDTAGGRRLLLAVYFAGRRLRCLGTDSGCAGTLVAWAARLLSVTIKVVRRPAGQPGFQVLPQRWVVERTLAWLTAHRRRAGDYERLSARAESFLHWTMIGTMVRRIDRGRPATRPGRRPLLKVS